ncbi:MAG: xanthine dehydrogenase family protein molybdopterin-binding subunit, partial [Proteobacteria bacterium]|nr:xanthine dehydrogenase family protein molybdopterin-binding subunit [Pseudomonadota bacterium]
MAFTKFGVGQPVPRTEDPRLLRGEGRYTDDINLPSQAYAIIVRSRHAHGMIRNIDVASARGMPGVLGVYTGADLKAAGFGTLKCITPFPNRDGTPMRKPPRPALATERVRFVGDPVAFVVAETIAQARDAAEAVTIEIDSLPAVTTASAAARPGAPLLYDEAPGNVALDYHYGDADKVAAAFAQAAHVTHLKLINSRLVVCAMEPRSAIGVYDRAGDRWTLHVGCQGVFGLRGQLAADVLGVPVEKLHVIAGNVGGSFGMKGSAYPEYVCLFHAARALGRTLNLVKNTVSVYKTPFIEVNTKCVFTNTVPVSSYRGAGRPESNYYMERLVDAAAAEMGIDRAELRRRNHIRPEQMPYQAASGLTYDSGDFTTLLDRALDAADWNGFERRRQESRKRGKLRGRGLGNFLEVTGAASKEMGGIRFEADGTVTIITGTLDHGQGHATPFAQVLSERLGIPFQRIRLVQGDSDELVVGGGTGGSRSMMASGAAIVDAGKKVIEQGKQIAAFVLEAAAADIEFTAGRFVIVGTDRAVGIMELAERIRGGIVLPPEVPQSLDVKHVHDGVPSAFPNGCHVAEVEIDPETGVVEVVKYSSV